MADEIGTCPECGERIDRRHMIIEYETETGESRVYAACPGCESTVRPA